MVANSYEEIRDIIQLIGFEFEKKDSRFCISDENGVQLGYAEHTDDVLSIALGGATICISDYTKDDISCIEELSGDILFGESGIKIRYFFSNIFGHSFTLEETDGKKASITGPFENRLAVFSEKSSGMNCIDIDKKNPSFIDTLVVVETEFKNILKQK
jgi:hypothetical protein